MPNNANPTRRNIRMCKGFKVTLQEDDTLRVEVEWPEAAPPPNVAPFMVMDERLMKKVLAKAVEDTLNMAATIKARRRGKKDEDHSVEA